MRRGNSHPQEPHGVISTRYGWVITIMLTLLFMVNWADKAVLGLAAEPIIKEFHLTNTDFGLLSGIFFLLFGLTGILAGAISTRVPTTRIMTVLAILWAISMIPVLILPTLAMLYLSRIILGAAEGPTSPLIVHAVHKWFPEDRRAIPTGLSQAGGALGVLISGPILTWVIYRFGWRYAFAILAIVAVVWVVVWLFIGKEGPLTTYAAARSGDAEQLDIADPEVSYWRLLLSPTWIGCALVGIGGYWALVAGVVWMPRLLEGALHYSHSTVGFLVAVPPVLSVFSLLFFPWISERAINAGANRRLMSGVLTGAILILCGIAAALVPVIKGPVAVLLMCIAFGLPSGIYPLIFLMVAHISPVRRRGPALTTATALVTTVGGLASPILLGVIMDRAGGVTQGFSHVFAYTSVIMIIGGLIGIAMVRPGADARRFGLV